MTDSENALEPEVVPRGASRWGGRLVAWIMVACASVAVAVRAIPLGIEPTTDVPLLAIAVAGIAGAVVFAISMGESPVLRRRSGLAVAALTGWAILSAVLAPNKWTALFGAPGFSMGLLALLALVATGAAASVRSRGVVRALTAVAPWVLVAQLAAMAYEVSNGFSLPGGTLSNSSYLGQVVVICVPLVLAPVVATGAMVRWAAVLRWLLAASMLWVLFAGGARLAVLVLVLELVGLALMGRSRERTVDLASRAMTPLVAAGAALAAALTFLVAALAEQPWVAGVTEVIGQYWKASLAGLASVPLTGLGPDGAFRMVQRVPASVALAFAQHTSGASDMIAGDVHNAVFSLLFNYGVIGLLLVGWLLIEVAIVWRASLRRGGIRALALMMSVVAYGITTLICTAPVQGALLFALVAGASLGIPSKDADEQVAGSASTPRWIAVAAFSATCLVSSLILATHAGTHLYVGAASEPVSIAETRRLQRAADLWTIDPYLYYRAADRWNALLRVDPKAFVPGLDLQDAARAASLSRDTSRYAKYHAWAMDAYARPRSDVLAEYRRAVELYPSAIDARRGLARYLLKIGRPREALPHAVFVDRVVTNESLGAALLADVYGALGRKADSARARARAERLYVRFGI